MIFHSWLFVAFLALVVPVALALRGTRFGLPWLLAASCVFYASWNPFYLLLILTTTAVDFFSVTRMATSAHRGRWLALSVAVNLGLLSFFKYGAFLTENVNALLAHAGLSCAVPVPTALFPVGISFFTFRSLSYAIDCYRGQCEREPSFLRYATFVSLFPSLLMGPIDRAGHLLPQLRERPPVRAQDVGDGFSLFVVGLFKKVALADYLALYVDQAYARPGDFGAPALLLATVAYTWQIYFDFSGYTDMARGVARLLGFRLMLNFDHPYLADSLGDFWRRWHISLSFWFRDYVYVPLGGNRHGRLATHRNMVLTMLLSGLWHGAAWTFLLWGAVHAVGRVVTRELERTAFYRDRVPRLAKQFLVFAWVSFAWIFFRARTVGDAWLIVRRLFAGAWTDPRFPLLLAGLVLAIWLYQFLYESKARRLLELAPVRIALVVFAMIYLATFPAPSTQPFIYLQF